MDLCHHLYLCCASADSPGSVRGGTGCCPGHWLLFQKDTVLPHIFVQAFQLCLNTWCWVPVLNELPCAGGIRVSWILFQPPLNVLTRFVPKNSNSFECSNTCRLLFVEDTWACKPNTSQRFDSDARTQSAGDVIWDVPWSLAGLFK